MVEFGCPLAFGRFQRNLWDFLDERCPSDPDVVPNEIRPRVVKFKTSIAEKMCERSFLKLSRSEEVETLTLKLRECADLCDKHVPGHFSFAMQLRKKADSLQSEIDVRQKYLEQHSGANWVARFVAEECAAHFYSATGQKPRFANSGTGDGPSSKYGKLVQDALIHLGLPAGGWQRACKLVCKRFDPDTLIVSDWSDG